MQKSWSPPTLRLEPSRLAAWAAAGLPGQGGSSVPSGQPAATDASIPWADLLDAVERREWRGRRLAGITDDSRAVRAGGIFVACPGRSRDGHDFAAEARARGAALVVSERPAGGAGPTCLVADSRVAISALADAWHGHPARRLRVVGVTGTNGKTTTTWLLASILGAAGQPACVIGNLGVWLQGERWVRPPWTTPPPMELHGILAAAEARGATAVSMEVSAQALSQHRVDHCCFAAGAVTNLSREHGEYFATAAEYRQAKLRLLRLVEAGPHPAGVALFAGLPGLGEFRRSCRTPQVLFGPHGDIEVLQVHPRGLEGTDVILRLTAGGGRMYPIRFPLPGAHNLENMLAAAALAALLGVPGEQIAAGLAQARGVPGRLQHVQAHPYRVLVDYAHNPAGLRALLGLLRRETPGSLVLVMGARGQRDGPKRVLMGAVAAAFCDRIVLTSDRPDGEDPAEAAGGMRAAVADVGVPVAFVADRFRAMEAALGGVRPGDCVVAVGKGEEAWGADDSGLPGNWDDVTALERILQALGPSRQRRHSPAGARG